jgi:O-antigen ligase
VSFISPRRQPNLTGAPTAADVAQLALQAREALFVIVLVAVWLTTRPFTTFQSETPIEAGGDVLNQLVFLALGAASVAVLAFRDPRVVAPVLQLSYAFVILALLVSLRQSGDPAAAFRALVFTLIVMGIAATLFTLPRSPERFRLLLFSVCLFVVAVSWAGVFALPGQAVHTDFDPAEPEHAGSWRGHYTHKNIAGAMMGVFTIIGLYALRAGHRRMGLALALGAALFLYLTRSKTSFGLLPVAVAVVFLVERTPWLWARLVLTLTPIAAINLLTAGSAIWPSIAAFNRAALSDPSFTGRFDIWRFSLEKLVERPWTGFGFESFWLTDRTIKGESKLELAWGVEKIVHGHNSYLDIALTLGLPALALVVFAFIVKPVLDHHRATREPDNRLLASCFLMIWLFIALGMSLEVYFFRRADPVWFAFLFAVLGLRYLARHRLG